VSRNNLDPQRIFHVQKGLRLKNKGTFLPFIRLSDDETTFIVYFLFLFVSHKPSLVL